MHSLIKSVTCLQVNLSYSSTPVLNLCGRLIFRSCLAFAVPSFHVVLAFVVMFAVIFVH